MTLFYLFAGEASADLHGAHLMRALKEQLPKAQFTGVGGPLMRAGGLRGSIAMEEFEVMGLSDVLKKLPSLILRFHEVKKQILQENPKAVILIDYPGFNLRLAKALRKQGFKNKLIQYISPSVWAHGKHRIESMAATLDLLLTIYPFEPACFSGSKLQVEFVGNPLLEYEQETAPPILTNLPPKEELVALFPGSRAGEIARNLPDMLEAAFRMQEEVPHVKFAISCAHPDTMALIDKLLKKTSLCLNRDIFLVPKAGGKELMRRCRLALAKSGTVTLELALALVPTVVVYHLSWLNRFYAKRVLQVNLPHYCIVNILAGREIFPELIEERYSAQEMTKELLTLWSEGPKRKNCLEACQEIRGMLGGAHASRQAALSIVNRMSL